MRTSTTARIQRACACGGKAAGECENCKISRKAFDVTAGEVRAPAIVHEVLTSPGRALDQATQASMGARFHFDFGRVRIHDDVQAARSASAISALAYTAGHDIVFAAGRYAPATDAGRRLLAHELTHVVQQHATQSAVPQRFVVGETQGSDEREADAVADAVAAGAPLPAISAAAPVSRISRAAISDNERILDLGSCAELACGDVFSCQDDAGGISCPDGTANAFSKKQHKFTAHLRCDPECDKKITPCSDSDQVLALPSGRFASRKCGQTLTLCANGTSTTATVRERSNKNSWEASPAVAAALGVSPDFHASIYPDPADPEMARDPRCHPKPTKANPTPPAPKKSAESK